MTSSPIKQLSYTALLIMSILWVFTSCSKIGTKPNAVLATTTGNDSTVVVDSLPSFNSPSGIAVDATGNIYVADYGNNLIRKITSAGLVSTLAGSGTQGSANGSGVLASFTRPAGVAVDASGNLYIADSGNNLIREITPAGLVSTLAGTSDTTGAIINGAAATATFNDPVGVALDASNNVLVADAANSLIRKITTGGIVSIFAGVVDTSTTSGTTPLSLLLNPTGVTVDGTGNVFVAGYLSNTILEASPAGTLNIFAGTGQPGATNGAGSSASFYLPTSVALDAADNVYVADATNNLIRKITPAGVVSTFAGSGAVGDIDSTGTAASFNGPSGLAVDAAGNVYVADTDNDLIRKITPAGVVSTIAGNGEPGSKNGIAVARRNKKPLKNTSRARFSMLYKKRTY